MFRFKTNIFGLICLCCLASLSREVVAAPFPEDVEIQPLGVIRNDRDASVSYLDLMIGVGNPSDVRGIYIENHKHNEQNEITTVTHLLNEIQSHDGAALDDSGHRAIVLNGEVNGVQGAGNLQLKFIYNGLINWHSKCDVKIRKSESGFWEMVNAYTGQIIDEIQIKTWKLGISTIGNVCPEP